MKYAHFISVTFWLAVGVVLFLWSLSYNIGTPTQPGPGFYPLGLGILLIFFSLILLGQGIRSFPTTKKVLPFSVSGGWKRVAYVVLVLLLLTFFFETIGYLSTFFLLIMLLMVGAGLRNWKRILLVAFFSALGVYLVFVLLLQQPLPRGFLGV
jgi:putative tricarboxylic transport membrane protein